MPTTITFTASAEVLPLLEKLRNLPEVAVRAVQRGMALAGTEALGNAVKFRFTGKGPFPVSEHKLGQRTNRLRQSMAFTQPVINPDRRTVEMRFGSNVSYFAIHEFGFTGRVRVKGHIRAAVNDPNRAPVGSQRGRVTRKTINEKKNSILVKGRNNFAYVKPHTRNLVIAARAPLGTELSSQRTQDAYFSEIGRELVAALGRKGGPK